jgi:outer membrane receptor for ferrienterochelin and colicins
MRRHLSAGGVVLAIGLAAPVARADDTKPAPIDDLDLVKLLNVQVSTATKTSEGIDEAPAVITVVTRDDIHRWGYQSVGEVLSHCVGFYLIDDHILPNAGVRGMTGGLGAESGVVKVMIDGRSVAYRTTSGNWLGVELVPLESVKQIEIIRGPASALYGADAFLGVVNVITDPPDETRPVRARLFTGATGSNPSEQLDVVSGGQSGRFDYMVGAAGEYGSRSGLTLPPESPAPTLPVYVGARRVANNLDRRSLVLQGRVGYREPTVGHVVLSTYVSGFERGGDFAPWAQLTNSSNIYDHKVGTVVSEGQLRVNLDGLLHATRTLDLELQSTYFRGGVLPADRIEIGSDLFYVRRNTSYRGVDSVLEARWIPAKRYNLIGGIEGIYDQEDLLAPRRINRLTDQAVLSAQATDYRAALVNLGAFVSSNVTVIDQWLKLTGGVRYDNHSIYGGQLTGRVGATSRWSDALVTKALYGSAFKAPSPYLLYASPLRPGDVEGNAKLNPQTIQTLEFQVSWKPNAVFGATSGISYNWLFDKAEFTPQGINQTARNVASQRSLSWETRLDAKHYEDYTGYLSAEIVRSVRDLGQEGYAAGLVGTDNVVYPPYIFRAGLMIGLPSPLSFPLMAGGEAIYVGPRRAADTSQIENGGPFDLPPYALINLSIATRELYLFRGQESRIALRVKNLLQSRGPDPGFSGFEYPLTPREIFLEIQHTY